MKRRRPEIIEVRQFMIRVWRRGVVLAQIPVRGVANTVYLTGPDGQGEAVHSLGFRRLCDGVAMPRYHSLPVPEKWDRVTQEEIDPDYVASGLRPKDWL